MYNNIVKISVAFELSHCKTLDFLLDGSLIKSVKQITLRNGKQHVDSEFLDMSPD